MAGPFIGGGGNTGGGSGSGASGGGGNPLDRFQPGTKKLEPRVEAIERYLKGLVVPADLSGAVKRLQMEVEGSRQPAGDDDDRELSAAITSEARSRARADALLEAEIAALGGGSSSGDIDGGEADSVFGGVDPINAGGA